MFETTTSKHSYKLGSNVLAKTYGKVHVRIGSFITYSGIDNVQNRRWNNERVKIYQKYAKAYQKRIRRMPKHF